MHCYECLKLGVVREAAALCHHCSAALCMDHVVAMDNPIAMTHLLAPTVVFSKKARLLLCQTCSTALLQTPANDALYSQTEH